MTLAQKIKRAKRNQRHYRRHADRIRKHKRAYMAQRKHHKAITAAIEAARKLLTVSPIATKPRSEACV